MKQTVQVKTWGNSKGIRIPRNVLEALGLDENSELDISVDKESGSILLTKEEHNEITPYQRLMLKGASKERKQIIWDRLEEKH